MYLWRGSVPLLRYSSSSSFLLSSLELSDTNVYGPCTRALRETASQFCKAAVLKSRTTSLLSRLPFKRLQGTCALDLDHLLHFILEILCEKIIRSRLSGHEVFHTACSLLAICKNSCSQLHRQKCFNLIPFSHKIGHVSPGFLGTLYPVAI